MKRKHVLFLSYDGSTQTYQSNKIQIQLKNTNAKKTEHVYILVRIIFNKI